MTDVNELFATEKADQLLRETDRLSGATRERNRENRLSDLRAKVATGEMSEKVRADGSVVFTALSGWDTGEEWHVSAAQAVNENVIVAANHGLEEVDGKVSLYLKDKPAWHSLGTVIPGGLSTSSAVLAAAGLDWHVEKRPIEYRNIITGDMETMPRQYLNQRTDTGKALGVVGEIYTPLQNFEAYEMLEDLIGLGMVCESAGVLDGGSRVFVTAEVPEAMIVDPGGLADKVRQFLAIMNSHDGKTPLTGVLTPWRIACGNTHRFAVRDAAYRWKIRHTKNAKNKIEEARRALGMTVEYYTELAAEETALVHTDVTSDDVESLISELWAIKKSATGEISKRSTTIDTNRREKIHELFAFESGRVGRNAYALENAITGYVDHFADLRPRGDLKGNRLAALGDAIMNENNDEKKSAAHVKLMTLTNR